MKRLAIAALVSVTGMSAVFALCLPDAPSEETVRRWRSAAEAPASPTRGARVHPLDGDQWHRADDVPLEVDGEPVADWDDVREHLRSGPSGEIAVHVRRAGPPAQEMILTLRRIVPRRAPFAGGPPSARLLVEVVEGTE